MSDIEKQLADIQRALAAIQAENKMLLKMQKSILQGQKHYHVAGGFCWGNTADGASFLVLYPKSEKLKEKICRVYADDYQFDDIPEWIRATQEDTGLDTTKDKEWAQKKGVYHTCPAMGVITTDGKETQMGHEKRFAGVLWVAKGQQERTSQPTPTPAQPAANGQPADPFAIHRQRAALLYGEDAATALAVLCRACSLGKISDVAKLNPAQIDDLNGKIALRMELHSAGKARYGAEWPGKLLKAIHHRNELYDLDAELSDEQVSQMIAAIRQPERVAA